ncbi:hypothetical protein EJ06DRAFT_529274 [Trichodelitschia bisporula]|uniref:Ricin B lectin domain-containing protein n=1 Tax=Trichodelitschia bisporula TaxID=703511 RepID=A0A6G1HZE5_9PEZI|nr:hypothetical protein EJ06DRAFT_529274 [Trichodelitschia bisporula]
MTIINPTPNKTYILSNTSTGTSLLFSSHEYFKAAPLTPSTEPSPHNHIYFIPTTDNPSYCRIHTRALGDNWSLGVIKPIKRKLHFYKTGEGNYSDQYWRLDTWGDGTVRLSNGDTGEEVRLDVDTGTKVPFMGKGERSEQHWTLAEV